ncbi:N-acetylneuraminate synthase family protein [Dyadobacter pollutisoli]|uniref:N-acetylneuraminate synthase family protein n=1 Tax=Dyadobacter pollutisoli TaxID=2910158 RepID=A0A9E8N829_9BACT|nr:N-acetylneuraminate synthase family protein [Dyadobacter pollutisoli]WAC10513.1 N-acetylneuraminate synthase family protein [Dyadobacter pollutisoli]
MQDNIYIIGEIGQAHDGSIGMAHAYIDALALAGVDAAKFQMHIADAESSIYEPFRNDTYFYDHSRMDYWRRMEFTKLEWVSLKKHCKEKKLDFIVSPFSNEAVDLLQEIGADKVKIGSAEAINLLIINKISKKNKDIIISSGMSQIAELDDSIAYLKDKNCNLALLQCTTAYPTSPHQWGLNMIADLRDRYHIPIGFSDHSGNIYACLAAASMGARLLEFHIVFDQKMFGPDASSSLTVDNAITMVKGVRQIEAALKNPVDKNDDSAFETSKTNFGRSLSLNKSLQKGQAVSFDDLESKKPAGYGIPVKCYLGIIGKKLARNMEKWEFLNEDDLI